MSKSMRVVPAFVLCIFATVMIRGGPLALTGIGEQIAITLVWFVGVAYMVWTIAKKSGRNAEF